MVEISIIHAYNESFSTTIMPLSELTPIEDTQNQGHDDQVMVSIRERGLVNPLLCYREGDEVHIQLGCTRYRALKLAGYTHAPVNIFETSEEAIQAASEQRKFKEWREDGE